jgi:hypothetical protein
MLAGFHHRRVNRAGELPGGGVLHPVAQRVVHRRGRFRQGAGGVAVGLGHPLVGDDLRDLSIGDVRALEAPLAAKGLDVLLGGSRLVEGLVQLASHPLIAGALVEQAQLHAIAARPDLQVVFELEQVGVVALHAVVPRSSLAGPA